MSSNAKIKSEPVLAMDVDDSNETIDPRPIAIGSNSAIGIAEVGSDNNISKNNEDNGDDDEIVREIPVFLSPELSKQIHLIQYPLQKQANLSQPTAVRVKPRHCMMEMDFDVPSNIQMNGLYSMASRTFTSHTVPVLTHMALGRMMLTGEDDGDNDPKKLGLHLVPLSRITQMRPSFSHIDEAFASASATTEEELKRQSQLQTDSSSDRRSISLQKKESERQALARKSSYEYKKASEESESWDSLEIFDEKTLQAKLIMDKVKCPLVHQSRNLFDPKRLEKKSYPTKKSDSKGGRTALTSKYLNTLNYLPPRKDIEEIDSGNSVTNDFSTSSTNNNNDHEQKKLLRVVSKLVRLMRQGRPIPFSLLRAEFSTDDVSDETLLVALGSCAVLVHGNFCLNSKLLSYPPAMTQARTFLLCLFQYMRTVHRERLMHVYGTNETTHKDTDDDDKLTPEAIEFLLEQVGKKTKDGWVLKIEDDVKFMEKNPQTVLIHLQYWAKQIELFKPMLLRYRNNPTNDDDKVDMNDS